MSIASLQISSAFASNIRANSLTELPRDTNIALMINRNTFCKGAATSVIALVIGSSAAAAGEQAKAIINGVPPEIMNELLEQSRTEPDSAFAGITPISANKHRFIFIWPAANPIMTYEKVDRNFAKRLIVFAEQLKPLATGFCLPSKNMVFGTAEYGAAAINVAYRDIEVRYQFGFQPTCTGQYIAASELDRVLKPRTAIRYGAGLAQEPLPTPEGQGVAPDPLKRFLGEPPAQPTK